MERTLETMWKTLEAINALIKFSDTKASTILAANGVILTIVFSKGIDYRDFLLNNQSVLLFLLLGFLSGFISIYFSICCLNPILDQGDPNSLLYFGNISKKYINHNEYKIDVMRYLKDDLDEMNQVTEQVWITSKIASRKYSRVSWATRFFIGLIIFFSLSGIDSLILYQKMG